MKCLLSALLLVSVIASASTAFAEDSPRQVIATLNQRQIRVCMAKRMSSDKALHYNEAKKACAANVNAQNQSPAASLAAPSAGGGK